MHETRNSILPIRIIWCLSGHLRCLCTEYANGDTPAPAFFNDLLPQFARKITHFFNSLQPRAHFPPYNHGCWACGSVHNMLLRLLCIGVYIKC